MDALTLLAELERIVPGFSSYVGSEENLFDASSPSAIFAACSHFVREHPVAVESWRSLGEFLNRTVSGTDRAIVGAACTCFLENLADPAHPLKTFLDGEALRYWKDWEAAG